MAKQQTERKEYRLGSAPMLHAPGLVKFALHAWRTAATVQDAKAAIGILGSWETVPVGIVVDLLNETGEVEMRVEGETVILARKDQD